MNQNKEETPQMRLWIDIAVAYTSSGNSTDKMTGAIWADYFVQKFNEKFKEEK